VTITNGYCTRPQLKTYLGIAASSNDRDDLLDDAVNTASRAVESHCGRVFFDAGSATARTFAPFDRYRVWVDEFSTTSGLIIKTDADDDGSFETTWASTDYELEPVGGVVNGVAGWPYRMIRAVDSYQFVVGTGMARRQTLQVTARWGWAAVPELVRQSTLQVASEVYRRKDAPFGVAQTVDFGPLRLSSDVVRGVSALLERFVVNRSGFGMA
jgi:hypothetical protein